MLTESSLTNILTVSGITHIKYRCYRHSCPRIQLSSFIRSAPALPLSNFPPASSPSPLPSNLEGQDPVAAAYTTLLASNVPCTWRFATGGGSTNVNGNTVDYMGDTIMSVDDEDPLQTKNTQTSSSTAASDFIMRELWIFAIDEQQAGLWDGSAELGGLEETRSGSFSWETIFAITASAPASPLSPVPRTGSSSTMTVSEEYQLFIIATRNLVERSMISRGVLPLGDYYVFPSDPYDYDHPGYADRDITEGMLPTACYPARETMLSCNFNVYLSSANLIFQPVVKHLRVRSIRPEDLVAVGAGADGGREKGRRVLLSPSGTVATLLPLDTLAPPHDATPILCEWSTFFGIPLSKLRTTTTSNNIPSRSRATTTLPPLVPVKTATETLLYPSALIFISTPIKGSSNGVAGTTGLGGYNSGLVEELGDKIDRWAWEDRVVEITAQTKHTDAEARASLELADAVVTAGMKRTSEGAELMEVDQHPLSKRIKIKGGQESGESVYFGVSNGASANFDRKYSRRIPDTGIDYWQYADPLSYITNAVLTQAALPDSFGPLFQGMIESPGRVGTTSATKDSPSRTPATPDNWFGQKRKSSTGLSLPGNAGIGGVGDISPGSMMLAGVGSIGMGMGMGTASGMGVGTGMGMGMGMGMGIEMGAGVGMGMGMGMGMGIGVGTMGISAVGPVSPPMGVVSAAAAQSPEKAVSTSGMTVQMMRGPSGNGVPIGNEAMSQVQVITVPELQMGMSVATTTPNTPMTMPQGTNSNTIDPAPQTATQVTAATTNGAPVYPSPPDNNPDNMGLSFGIEDMGTMEFSLSLSAWGDVDNYSDLDMVATEVTEDDWKYFDSESATTRVPGTQQTNTVAPLAASVEPIADNLLQPVAVSTPRELLAIDIPKDEDIDLDQILAGGEFITLTDASAVNSLAEASPIQAKTVTPGPINFTESPEPFPLSSAPPAPVRLGETSPDRTTRETINVELRPYTPKLGTRLVHQFVPPDFAPLIVLAGVNDAKYGDGGKFVYAPPKKKRKKRVAARALYRPDYIPEPPVKTDAKKKDKANSTDDVSMPNSMVNGVVRRNEAAKVGAALDRMGLSDFDSSSDSNSESDSNRESEDDDNAKTARRDITVGELNSARMVFMINSRGCGGVNERLVNLRQVSDIVNVKLEDGQLSSVNGDFDEDDRFINLDYDSPFASMIVRDLSSKTKKGGRIRTGEVTNGVVDGAGEVERWESTSSAVSKDIFFRTVDCLCQQAIMGGYPFAGGLIEIAGRGGEIVEGESTQVFVTRRRGLVQGVVGDMTVVPALIDDACNLISEFKTMLAQTFDPTHIPEGGQQAHHFSTPAVVSIKGPLSIQQYYDLAETNQTQSKYGKYQVKKRRPMEPSLDLLPVPEIVVGQRDEWIAGSPHILRFWEKLRLEPYSSRKNIVYFVVYPQSAELEESIKCFFKELGSMYETCSLGTHQPGADGEYTRGLVPVQLLPGSAGQTDTERKTKSYMAACQKLGSTLGTLSTEGLHVIIYMVNPFGHSTAYFDLGLCFTKLMVAFHAATMGSSTSVTEKQRERVALQLIPIEHVLRPTGFGGFLKFGLKEIAFSVYSKCLQLVDRTRPKMSFDDPTPFTEVYAPPFVLAKSVQNTIQFSLKRSLAPYPTLLDQSVFLHLAYCWSLDRRWFLCVWIDSRGELLEYAAFETGQDIGEDISRNLAPVFSEAWERTLRLARRTGFSWNFVVGKLGLMYNEELQEWMNVVRTTSHVSVVCVDIDSPLQVYPSTESASILPEGMNTPTSSGAPTPEAFTSTTSTPNNIFTTQNRLDVFEDASGETHALLLNHRVAFSKTRRRVIEGILGGDFAEGGDENWMLPLASGYLAQTPAKSEAPNKEKFCLEPHSIEIHLLHCNSSNMASSILRDIVKQYHALSFLNATPTNTNCVPMHFVLVERLCRVLMLVE
ncbi:hypothetical protein BC937DRAFT_86403 [Endogone sp. FLAS-F59071]|nr:hypothetical protein BC937DRAFT_86403 [Endogone sp. FLAS-F59071]|eukprot:RUS20078.1 hypothetical protein BC937DRAFT_86403 [Endogone sp. FLAS-F59071]